VQTTQTKVCEKTYFTNAEEAFKWINPQRMKKPGTTKNQRNNEVKGGSTQTGNKPLIIKYLKLVSGRSRNTKRVKSHGDTPSKYNHSI
jgi:hypothetical protein